MWDFEHPPLAAALAERYELHWTRPSECAANLLAGRADLGLIPIAALTPELAIVPGCTIASLDRVRSIQLIVKVKLQGQSTAAFEDDVLRAVRTVAADTASRSSLAYAQVLFHKFLGVTPEFLPAAADPVAMLRSADAALLIGDPALLALEARDTIEQQVGPCLWVDLAHQWHTRTGLPWVAAVWAVRPEALGEETIPVAQLVEDLIRSRDHGLANIAALVSEWTPRIGLPAATIHTYLTQNIHYRLDPACIEALHRFRSYAAEIAVLPPLPAPLFL
jgi:chorismate dehydratase